MEKQHAEKCKSKQHKYYGDARNVSYLEKQMKDCQKQHPKSIVKLEIETGSILIEYPLPEAYFKITKFEKYN